MTKSPPLLVIHPKPEPGESVLGYCLRLGEANGFADLRWLAHVLGQSRRKQIAGLRGLEQLTGHTPRMLGQAYGPSPRAIGQYNESRLGLKVTYWNGQYRRWCPECLNQRSIWKAEWALSLQVACPVHKRLLLERCPTCHEQLKWTCGGLLSCHCGGDLRFAPPSPAEPTLLGTAHQLSIAFHLAVGLKHPTKPAGISQNPLLKALNLPQLCDLLWVFGAYALQRPCTRPQMLPNHGEMQVILPFLGMAVQTLEDWPRNFYELLEQYTKEVEGDTASLRVFLQEFHQALARLLIHPELQFVRREFERYVHTRWKEKLVLNRQLRDAHPIMSGAEAAKRLGMPVRALHKLIVAGEISGSQSKPAKGRVIWLVDRASVELFERNVQGFLTATEVESLLRITPQRIRLLVEHGILTALPRSSNRAAWQFRHGEISAFLEKLDHGNVNSTPLDPGLISVWEITKRWMQGNEQFLAVVRALSDGELKTIGRSPQERGLRALLVPRDEFMKWHQCYRHAQGFYTIPEAAAHIHINKNHLYQMIGRSLVCTSEKPWGYEKRPIQGVHIDELNRFCENYVWGKRLGGLLGLSEHAAARALMAQGIHPICGPTVDEVKGYIFRMADIPLPASKGETEYPIPGHSDPRKQADKVDQRDVEDL